jgi:hypothetical protein
MVAYVKIKGKEYPFIYNIFALMSAADSMGMNIQELNELFQSEEGITDTKMFRILYSGLVAGAEQKKKRLHISFPEFLEMVMFDEEAAESLGTLFQRHFELLTTKMMEQADDKKKVIVTETSSDSEMFSSD